MVATTRSGRLWTWMRGATLTLSLSLGAWSAALAGEVVPVEQLPEPVVRAIMERFPQAELVSAERDDDDGQVYYEVDVRSEGALYEVEVSDAGVIREIEREQTPR